MTAMTEDEAREKWCPMQRPMCRCIASKCMAWEWTEDYRISLSNGFTAIVDGPDAVWVSQINWWWDGKYTRSEAGRLHVLVYEHAYGPVPDNLCIDHIDGHALNCRSGNLRTATSGQNGANAASRGGKSRYRGVHKSNSGKWVAQISKDGIRECLGTFESEEDAARAYDKAAVRIHGEYARLNLKPRENVGRRGYCGAFGAPS